MSKSITGFSTLATTVARSLLMAIAVKTVTAGLITRCSRSVKHLSHSPRASLCRLISQASCAGERDTCLTSSLRGIYKHQRAAENRF